MGTDRDRPPFANALLLCRLGIEERIPVLIRWDEGLLDHARAHPADEIERRAGFVVGPRRARSSERLLSDHRPRGLVVKVQIAGGVTEAPGRIAQHRALAREDGAGESV